ncbi:hypothetical protein P1P68_02550 [Streptomyces scabiei]|uniref:hypothetical protein n=1 Tax=Streptomyces scabiei TaxID=1930 RepID=UPI00298F5FE5|nr:hypothetical protein [Streptomyces scabiei]MDW8803716.1 hypothetical protein [Streptomyces scabiei]
MTDASLSGFSRLPHHGYIEAVALVDGPGGPYEPDEWSVDVSDKGALFATLYFRRTEPLNVEDRDGSGCTLAPVVNGEAWPHGVALSWDAVDGWTYTPLWDEFSTTEDAWEPLPIDRLAPPSAVRAVLVRLLDGEEYDLPASTVRWGEPRSATLADVLAGLDEATAGSGAAR